MLDEAHWVEGPAIGNIVAELERAMNGENAYSRNLSVILHRYKPNRATCQQWEHPKLHVGQPTMLSYYHSHVYAKEMLHVPPRAAITDFVTGSTCDS